MVGVKASQKNTEASSDPAQMNVLKRVKKKSLIQTHIVIQVNYNLFFAGNAIT